MAAAYAALQARLKQAPRRWLVTGAAGFIGSNLVETLLRLDQHVVGLDNLSTGYERNLEEVRQRVTPAQWARFRFIKDDIRDERACHEACAGIDYVLHNAALGSVPRSLEDPLTTHASNATGSLNMLVAARDAKVRRFVYAASSSTYGDHPGLPKVEDRIGKPLSPYAVTKYLNELYADVFARSYGISTVGLRYFNVFGRRQDPDGAYAAVIPRWLKSLLTGQPVLIHGDGETTRDFCYVENVMQANLLAATAELPAGTSEVYNVAVGGRTSLNDLFGMLKTALAPTHPAVQSVQPTYGPFRAGDVRHSQADVSKATAQLGYQPTHTVAQGLEEAIGWYVKHLAG